MAELLWVLVGLMGGLAVLVFIGVTLFVYAPWLIDMRADSSRLLKVWNLKLAFGFLRFECTQHLMTGLFAARMQVFQLYSDMRRKVR